MTRVPVGSPVDDLLVRIHALMADPSVGAVDIGDAAAVLLSLAISLAGLSPDPAAMLSVLDQTWIRLLSAGVKKVQP